MSLVVPIVGNVLLLRYMLNQTAPSDVILRLYNNNVTPSESSALVDFSESIASGYTAVSLPGSQWTVSSGVSTGSTATFAQRSFNFSTSDSIYGYFITASGTGTLLWAERFPSPFVLPNSPSTINIIPRISLD